MSRYHINTKGTPARCRAQTGNCPFRRKDGGESKHYETLQDAQKGYEAIQAKNTIIAHKKRKNRVSANEFFDPEPYKKVVKNLSSSPKDAMQSILENFDKFPEPTRHPNGKIIQPVLSLHEKRSAYKKLHSRLINMTPEELIRRNSHITEEDIANEEQEGKNYIRMSWGRLNQDIPVNTDLARHMLRIPSRKKTNSDITAEAYAKRQLYKARYEFSEARKREMRLRDLHIDTLVKEGGPSAREKINECQGLFNKIERKQKGSNNFKMANVG